MFKKTLIAKDNSVYPINLDIIGNEFPGDITTIGSPDILRNKKVGLFCSTKCPGNLIVATYDLACSLRDQGVTVISGFHTLMEKEALKYLLKGKQPIIICPARSIGGMRIPSELKKDLDQGRLLILSPFDKKDKRITAELALLRNRFVAAVADEVLVIHSYPGSKTEELAKEIVSWRKPFFTLQDAKNENLIKLGAGIKTIP